MIARSPLDASLPAVPRADRLLQLSACRMALRHAGLASPEAVLDAALRVRRPADAWTRGILVAARRLQQELRMFVVKPREGRLFEERNTPEFFTLVAVAVGLAMAVVVEPWRRRSSRR